MIGFMHSTESLNPGNARLNEPHRRLMAAVLQTVVDDCRGSAYRRSAGNTGPDSIQGVRQAVAYMASTDREWPFSFENLCAALDLDAGCLRRALHRVPGA